MSRILTVIENEALEIGRLYELAKSSIISSVNSLIEAGKLLRKKKESIGHGSWLAWLKDNERVLGFGNRTAERLISAAVKFDVNVEYDEDKAIKIGRAIWGNSVVRGTLGTGENEWYTPTKYIEKARLVLGAIDLDPASSDSAQESVQATKYFTEETNGLTHEWGGRVWLNPPYAQPTVGYFVDKMVEEYSAHRVTSAIMLTHNYTDTSWFHKACEVVSAICLTRGRIKFIDAFEVEAAPTQGQVFFYFGDDVDKFCDIFLDVGFPFIPR